MGMKLQEISSISSENKKVLNAIFIDLAKDKNHRVGRKGLNADQVLRCAILKTIMYFTYERLEFHLSDSNTMRAFAK